MQIARTKTSPTISACMIVKNEEACLSRCLDSVKDFVDEIIIVDTGSTDRTVEIARRYTDKLYFHPWEDSFSKARNQALAYASGDWIFQLDADEELFAEDGPRLREVIRKGKAENCCSPAIRAGI
ncbi:MAG: glycosyltransferase family 2 protein [Proteobacteria bacterium]|nr:glycosyltransferase family 2 protein [Pseudomonadota bacterium]